MAAEPLTVSEFTALLEDRFAAVLNGQAVFAVALSGGPDSMALAHLLNGWAGARGVKIHALTVDHGLRSESAREARQVSDWMASWSDVTHKILTWDGEKPQTRIQEEARAARYRLMEDYCKLHNIRCLFLAHHQDDQAETFLMRLAKGSGLDGLAAMRPVYDFSPDLVLLRPFLSTAKERLVSYCEAGKISYVKDPSNDSDHFARVRLRKSVAALEVEGLTSKRLALTAERLERASSALDILAENAHKTSVIVLNTDRIVYNYRAWADLPLEIVFRILVKGMKMLRPPGEYLPRMEKIESILVDVVSGQNFTKRTLGGLIFERDDGQGTFTLSGENKDKKPPAA